MLSNNEGAMMADAARGELLVRQTGVYHHATMTDSMDVIEWLRANRKATEQRGCCPGGCENKQLIPHEVHGHAVCPMTYEPCSKRRLFLIIKLLGVVNGKRNSNEKRND